MDIKQTDFLELLETLQTQQEAFFFREALELYIPPQVGKYVGDDEPQDAAQAIGNWLNSDKQCLLLLGDSGAGKTLFGQWLTRQSFKNQKMQKRIPLFIPLLTQKHPEENLIDTYLKETCGLEDEIQREWVKQQPLLLILDGFDEIHQKINLYRSNKLWQLKHLKIIISCRSQALANIYDYTKFFYPYNHADKPQPYQLQKYIINPFTKKQINSYLQQYVSLHQDEIMITNPDWIRWQTYETHIQSLPGLQALLASPFVLSIVIKVLPEIIAEHKYKQNIEQRYLVKLNLYDYFVAQWFVRQKKKLVMSKHVSDDCPIEELFAKCSKSIANAMLQSKVNSIELTSHKIIPLLAKQSFFSDIKPDDACDTKTQLKYFDEEIDIDGLKIKLSLILSGCPMMQLQKNHYAFLHQSLLEYFAARKLFEGVMVDASIALGYELNENLLVNEPETLKFLAEHVDQDDSLKKRLFDVLEQSKYEERVQIAAANAITILNYANVSFFKQNLSGIQISGADLSYANLQGADLSNANLTGVSLIQSNLKNTNLKSAILKEVIWGENSILMCGIGKIYAISPDSRWLALVDQDENIHLWSTKEKILVKTLKYWGLKKRGQTIRRQLLFSPNSCLLGIINAESKNVDIFNLKSGKLVTTENGPYKTDKIAFSPDGSSIACSYDSYGDIFLLDTHTGKKIKPLIRGNEGIYDMGYKKYIGNFDDILFHPTGSFLAARIALCETILIWKLETGECTKIYSKSALDANISRQLKFSTSGHWLMYDEYSSYSGYMTILIDMKLESQLKNRVTLKHSSCIIITTINQNETIFAAAYADQSIILWDINTNKILYVLKGHADKIVSLVFSAQGNIIISGSLDNTIRLWSTENGELLQVIGVHTDIIKEARFSDDDSAIIALGKVGMRFWSMSNIFLRSAKKHFSTHHANNITGIAFSKVGDFIVSCSKDCNIYLTESRNGFLRKNLVGYTDKKSMVEMTSIAVCTTDQESAQIIFAVSSIHYDGFIIDSWEIRSNGEIKNGAVGIDKMSRNSSRDELYYGPRVGQLIVSPNNQLFAYNCAVPDNYNHGPDAKTDYIVTVCFLKLGKYNYYPHCSDQKEFRHHMPIRRMSFSPDSQFIIYSDDKVIYLRDIQTGTVKKQFKNQKDTPINSLAYSPCKSRIAAGGADGHIYIWSIESGEIISDLVGHSSEILTIVFSPSGNYLASGSKDHTVRIWSLCAMKESNVLTLHQGAVNNMSFNPNGDLLASGDETGLIINWQIKYVSEVLVDAEVLWSSRALGMRCDGLRINNVFELSSMDYSMLQQRGGLGNPSTKKSHAILEARRAVIPYSHKQPPYDLFNHQYLIMPNNAIVSIVRKKSDQPGNKHVFLVIEYINEFNLYTIIRADFFLDQRQKHSKGLILSTGQALVEICVKSLVDMQELALQCAYKSWNINNNQVFALLANLEADQIKQIHYLSFGNSSLYHKTNEETHNCLSWCEKHLNQIGLDVSSQQSLLDNIVVHPNYHLPDSLNESSQEPGSTQKCFIM